MEYEIIYSKRRTLCLQIKGDGRVLVRAPYGAGKERLDRFVSEHIDWIKKRLERVHSYVPRYEFSSEEIAVLKEKLREIITPILEKYAKEMNVLPKGVSINSAKTRFGSCSSLKNLNFSYRLVFYPHEAIEYVCVHELAHLKEMNHSKKFWRIVEKHLPDYKERRALLK